MQKDVRRGRPLVQHHSALQFLKRRICRCEPGDCLLDVGGQSLKKCGAHVFMVVKDNAPHNVGINAL